MLTGDHDGFLFITTERQPDVCEDAPCVRVERFPSSGAGSVSVTLPFAPRTDRVRIFAGTDGTGAGHFAATTHRPDPDRRPGVSLPDELVWGAGMDGANHPARLALDTPRGLGTVAFDTARMWLVTHDWMPETTVGEGFSFPIAPEIVVVTADGAMTAIPGLDPTGGELFGGPILALSEHGAWLAVYAGALRVAGEAWSGVIAADASNGQYSLVAQRAGSIVVAHDFGGLTEIMRIDADGTRTPGPSLSPSPAAATIALATDGENVVLAQHTTDGRIEVTIFSASLEVIATGTAAEDPALDRFTTLGLAASNDGVFALLVAPFPTGGDFQAAEPVRLRRFRACE